jgi:hypothetical protein
MNLTNRKGDTMISVVCPFYNEESILDAAVRNMLANLKSLPEAWELVIVNDGSLDHSLDIARRIEAESPTLRVISYPTNRGRGYAIRTGVANARGDTVVTTEIDLSWGDDIVHRIVEVLQLEDRRFRAARDEVERGARVRRVRDPRGCSALAHAFGEAPRPERDRFREELARGTEAGEVRVLAHRGAGAPFVPELNQRIKDVAQSEGATLVDLFGWTEAQFAARMAGSARRASSIGARTSTSMISFQARSSQCSTTVR